MNQFMNRRKQVGQGYTPISHGVDYARVASTPPGPATDVGNPLAASKTHLESIYKLGSVVGEHGCWERQS